MDEPFTPGSKEGHSGQRGSKMVDMEKDCEDGETKRTERQKKDDPLVRSKGYSVEGGWVGRLGDEYTTDLSDKYVVF